MSCKFIYHLSLSRFSTFFYLVLNVCHSSCFECLIIDKYYLHSHHCNFLNLDKMKKIKAFVSLNSSLLPYRKRDKDQPIILVNYAWWYCLMCSSILTCFTVNGDTQSYRSIPYWNAHKSFIQLRQKITFFFQMKINVKIILFFSITQTMVILKHQIDIILIVHITVMSLM